MRFAPLLVFALMSGCGSCGKEAPPIEGSPQTGAVEPPVAAPEGLIAEVVIPTPNTTWGRVQRGVGGGFGILPATLGGVVCAFGGLDPSLGPEIDGMAPLVGVVTGGDSGAFGWALAMKLVEPRRAKDLLLDSETARYAAKPAAAMTQLVPKGGSMPIAAALANGGYLVIARDEADLARLGPYAYRTLPTRAVPESGGLVVDLAPGALKGPLRARVQSAWDETKSDLSRRDEADREKHGGRAPDFGDPQAILASLDDTMKERLAQMGDTEGGRLVVDADESQIHADLALKPSGGAASAAVASMRPGDAAPLAGALDGPIALLFRDDAAGRAQTASAFEAALDKALGARLAEPDTKRVHGAVDEWTKARGDWMVLGLLGIDGLYLLTPTASEAAMDKAIKDAADLARSAPVKDVLRIRDVKWSSPREAEIGYGEKKSASLKWSTAEGRAKITLTSGAPSATTLGDDAKIAAALKGLGAGVTFAAVIQPLKLDPNKALLPAAPLVLGYGTKDGRIWAHADVADPLVRELAKSRMGF